VTDSRKRRDGGWIETIGYYNPVSKEKDIKIDEERLNYWLKVGAQMWRQRFFESQGKKMSF